VITPIDLLPSVFDTCERCPFGSVRVLWSLRMHENMRVPLKEDIDGTAADSVTPSVQHRPFGSRNFDTVQDDVGEPAKPKVTVEPRWISE
jgi:hypothetical protein